MSKEKNMNYAKIYKNDFVNGEGVRTTLFVQGCSHACKGCYNQSTWNFDNGLPYTQEIENELIENLKRKEIDGLTLTGGDPMHPKNAYHLISLAKKTKEMGKTVWCWTGYKIDELNDENQINLLKYIDVLIDGKFEKEKYDPNLKWRGSSNQTIHILNK